MTEQTNKKVIITGAYGLIGNLVYGHMAAQPERYDMYAMVRRIKPSVRIKTMHFTDIPTDRIRLADLTDFEAVQRAMQGMDTVVHMAADPDGRSGWESVLNNNIIGAHNLFEACRLAGVKRIIYASTNQVVFGYMTPQKREAMFGRSNAELNLSEFPLADHTKPTRPMNDYACSKVYGEALAHMYAHVHGISCIVLRIGWVVDSDTLPNPKAAAIWCSHRDIIQIVERCVDAPPELRFDVFFGHSDNQPNLVDIQHAKDVLGYAPQDGQQLTS
jgi:NAD+ dependent glucose-6-phosphate dehydrogenase